MTLCSTATVGVVCYFISTLRNEFRESSINSDSKLNNNLSDDNDHLLDGAATRMEGDEDASSGVFIKRPLSQGGNDCMGSEEWAGGYCGLKKFLEMNMGN